MELPATPVHDLAEMAADPHIAHRASLDLLGAWLGLTPGEIERLREHRVR
jgi:crotonobetainyl-CoA:carnitine CoA-transferase CaiB-like acyl-CoA transferase